MKILFFTNEYSHSKLPSSGGVGSFLKIIANELSSKGHEIHIYGFSKNKHAFLDNSIKVEFFKKYSKKFPFTELLRSISKSLNIKNSEIFFLKKERHYLYKQLKQYSKKNNIDIIESFAFNGFTAYWDNSIPLVVRFHGSRGFWHYYLGAKKEENKILMEQKALETTPYTIAVSKFSATAVKQIYNIDVDKIIYNGIDSNLFAPNPEIKEIEHSIFYFGTLSEAKGVDLLCKVFNEIIKKFPEATLHLIGRGNDYWEYLSKNILSKLALANTIYYGSKQINELPNIIQKATVCVFPSLNETFGLIAIEAMSLEKVIITSNIESFNEIIDHNINGLITKSFDDYIIYINRIFNSEQEKIMIGKMARTHVLEHFTNQKMTESTLEYYLKILDNHSK